jgi:hypothetical protein
MPQHIFTSHAIYQFLINLISLINIAANITSEQFCYELLIFLPLAIKGSSILHYRIIHTYNILVSGTLIRNNNDYYRGLFAINVALNHGVTSRDSSKKFSLYHLFMSRLVNRASELNSKSSDHQYSLQNLDDAELSLDEIQDKRKNMILERYHQSCMKTLRDSIDIKISYANFLSQYITGAEASACSLLYLCKNQDMHLKHEVIINKLLSEIEYKI